GSARWNSESLRRDTPPPRNASRGYRSSRSPRSPHRVVSLPAPLACAGENCLRRLRAAAPIECVRYLSVGPGKLAPGSPHVSAPPLLLPKNALPGSPTYSPSSSTRQGPRIATLVFGILCAAEISLPQSRVLL